jgi:YD repeat-containing protein
MSDGSGYVNDSRLLYIIYPNGQRAHYLYDNDGAGLDDSISRVDKVNLADSEGETGFAGAYAFSGLDQESEYNAASDAIVNMDRFGRRWSKMDWTDDYSGTHTITSLQYGYDADGNILWKKDLIHSGQDELYAYDNLNRLIDFQRGTLNSTCTAISDPTLTESWDLDALGNWKSQTIDGVTTERTTDMQNELTAVGSNSLNYDANGSMTTYNGLAYRYDAWKRLVGIYSGATQVAAYQYDAFGRRITEQGSTSSPLHDLYYTDRWQVVEDQTSGATEVYLWSPYYTSMTSSCATTASISFTSSAMPATTSSP